MAEFALQVDYDKLRDIATSGIMRASVFMGIGTNVARIDPPVSHVLDDKAQFIVVPQKVTAETSQGFIREFESWTITNGFRELVETFSVFLVAVFSIAHILERGTVLKEDHDKAIRKFDRGGVEAQLAALTKTLGLDGRFSSMFESLNDARNCMAHRRGIVSLEDTGPLEEPFVLRWRTRSLMLEDGRDATLALYRGEPLYVEKGQAILSAEVERTKVFGLGEQIRLSRHDLSEICYGVMIATECVREGLINLGRKQGKIVDNR